MLKAFLTGFIVKGIASFDDALTRIPIIATVARTRSGQIAFSLGTLLAVGVAVILSATLSQVLQAISNAHIITGVLILLLAVAVHFDVFARKERSVQNTIAIKAHISTARFFKLIGIGFLFSLTTLLDDIIVFSPLFFNDLSYSLLATLGIFVQTLIAIGIIIYFADRIDHLKYTKELTVFLLVVLGLLVIFQII